MSVKRKKNIKFFSVYNTFTENEKTEFKKFLKFGIDSEKRNYSKILLSLISDENRFSEQLETKSDRTRWNRLSELSVLADKFLILKSIETNSLENNYSLLKEYDKRNLHSYFEHTYKIIKKENEKEPVVNQDYGLINKLDKLLLYQQKSTSDPVKFIKNFNENAKIRTGIYLIEMLENLIEIWNKKAAGILESTTIDEIMFKGLNFEILLSYFSETANSNDKLYYTIKFLYLIYLSLLNPEDTKNYTEAKKIFFKELKLISKEKRTIFYNYMTDLNLERANRSLPGAMEDLFYIISKKFKEGLLDDIKYNEIPVNKFRDYVYVAINLEKYTWVKNFVNNYGHHLPQQIREDNIILTKALLLHHSGNNLECFEQLQKVNRNNAYTYVDVTVLRLKALYELKKFDECHNELKNFKEYLRKVRIIQEHLKNYSGEFCKAFTLLLKLNQSPSKNNKSILQFNILKKNMIGKKWIISKMEEVKV